MTQFNLANETDQRNAIAACLQAYRSAASQDADLRTFAGHLSPMLQPAALAELVKLDIEQHLRAERRCTVEEIPARLSGALAAGARTVGCRATPRAA